MEGTQQLLGGEKVVSWAVDETLGGICHAVFKVGLGVEQEWLSAFNQAPGERLADGAALEKGRQWKLTIEELMAWLGWTEQWTGCEGPCGSNVSHCSH